MPRQDCPGVLTDLEVHNVGDGCSGVVLDTRGGVEDEGAVLVQRFPGFRCRLGHDRGED